MSLIVQPWELDRATRATAIMRQVLTQGVTGAESLPALLAELDPSGDPSMRRTIYAMLGALESTEPFHTDFSWFNNWVSLESALNEVPGVHMNPFGEVSWRGLIGRSTGTAVNTETMLSFPARFSPTKGSAFICGTNAGPIRVDVNPADGNTPPFLSWRTTGGYTGGYAYVFLNTIRYSLKD